MRQFKKEKKEKKGDNHHVEVKYVNSTYFATQSEVCYIELRCAVCINM